MLDPLPSIHTIVELGLVRDRAVPASASLDTVTVDPRRMGRCVAAFSSLFTAVVVDIC